MNKPLAFFKTQIGKDSIPSPSPLMRWLNPTLLKAEEGVIEFSYVIREEMTNFMQVLHGGATAAIIDDAIGAAIYSLGNTHAYTTVNLTVDYFSSVKAGETVIAKTSVVKKGNQIMNAECEVWNANSNRMVAKGSSNLIKTKIEL